jgi:hypothetical protein
MPVIFGEVCVWPLIIFEKIDVVRTSVQICSHCDRGEAGWVKGYIKDLPLTTLKQ